MQPAQSTDWTTPTYVRLSCGRNVRSLDFNEGLYPSNCFRFNIHCARNKNPKT
ncbi:hypothetical protein BABINDRAFT_93987 [Babjeviella inositovora NRRL Y-12698]|uniref:Uncharacterized protein n=1 Tax=Babjeviella inositovora NRRL Y-12698 TaxID=984486 RepID=A0A1E3QJZ6_9ASCO|nr:uncharacterized protein BABINDRAFT_93987 [Babjeviella inositovora NRRL Y-12698]ODQ77794.1 hypothetical protein BABINDRAFT_93987 [Babjeviella inositovora NRRL Y-12698]